MDKKIIIGFSSQTGPIYEDYEKGKACNLCIHFKGYGLHWLSGKCTLKDKEIGYFGDYHKTAVQCDSFTCKSEFLAEKEYEDYV